MRYSIILLETHFLLKGYFHTKTEMIAVSIVEVIEQN